MRRIEVGVVTFKFMKKIFARHCTSFSEPDTIIIDHSEHPGTLPILIYHPVILHKSRYIYVSGLCDQCQLAKFHATTYGYHSFCSSDRLH